MSSYIINISEDTEKDKHLVGLISEMAKTNKSIFFKKISNNKDILNTNPDLLTETEAEAVFNIYDEEEKTSKRYTIDEAKEKTLKKLGLWQSNK